MQHCVEGAASPASCGLDCGTRPIDIVNDSRLQQLMETARPGYTLPSRTHMPLIMRKKHADGKDEIISLLQSADAVAVTMDSWTSKAAHSFSTYMVHFFTDNWQLRSCVLTTRPLEDTPQKTLLASF